jgi:cyclopropane fatty-acyl-phospholipid synthase-like methyltransferase
MLEEGDVPSPIDLRRMGDARCWADTAMQRRPVRQDVFAAMVHALGLLSQESPKVLELGSGPGFFAAYLLQQTRAARYTGLDFSDAMHALARQRLGDTDDTRARVSFITANFKEPQWHKTLGPYDAIVTLQAVHELRHKRHAPALYQAVAEILRQGGTFLMGDHHAGPGGMSNTALYMTVEEHRDALRQGGFAHVDLLFHEGGLVLFRAQQ